MIRPLGRILGFVVSIFSASVLVAPGPVPANFVLGASAVTSNSISLHWVRGQASDLRGWVIYRDGRRTAIQPENGGPYFVDSHLKPLTSYTYAVSALDRVGHESLRSQLITVKTLAEGSSNTYTLSAKDPAATIYGIIDNAACGDTVMIKGGTYTMASHNLPMIYIKDKHCTTSKPYVIKAADFSNPPRFDYTGFPLDSDTLPVPNHWTPWESDFSRGAWQIHNSSYVTIEGLQIKGASGMGTDSVAGVRFIDVDHLTLRWLVLERNFNGLQGSGTNNIVEYDTFLANGKFGSDQQHQFYDTGGDNLVIRYNYFNQDGCQDCGQNIHTRSWHSSIYGNWIQDGSDYEWDMMTPASKPNPDSHTMVQRFYNNVVVTSPMPVNTTKVFTFYANSNFSRGIMKLDAEWNTFWIRGRGGSGPGGGYSLFQLANYSSGEHALGAIELHFSNNIVHFGTPSSNRNDRFLLYFLTGDAPWSITGDNNWFDEYIANTCATAITAHGGTCLLTTSTVGGVPPFRNMSGIDLRPATANNPFGVADMTESLRSPKQQCPAGVSNVTPRTSYTDVGALQFSQP
jgi:hypothetical protein